MTISYPALLGTGAAAIAYAAISPHQPEPVAAALSVYIGIMWFVAWLFSTFPNTNGGMMEGEA